MNSAYQNKNFDVLQAILSQKNNNFGISIEPAGTDISAAILVNIAINAEIPPSELLTPKVSKRKNKYKKCQI